MFKRIGIISTILMLLFSSIAFAHPGRTDSSGGHTCRTNCSSWGLSDGEYHYHGGSSTKSSNSSSSSSSSTHKAVDLRSDEEKKADSYIWQGEYYLDQGNYFNALYYFFKADETGYGWKVNDESKSTAAKKIADQAKAYYEKDQLDKAKQFYDLLAQDSYYQNLYDVYSNIELIKSRQAFLNAFGVAQWYVSQKNFINAVLLADKEMKEGLALNTHAIKFMKEAALKLAQQAYSAFLEEDYETSLKRYNVLANAENVPADLKEGAAKNVKIIQRNIKE